MVQKFLLIGAALAVAVAAGAVSRETSARASAAVVPAVNCTQAQKAKRLQALRAYKAKMGSARRAYFRSHRSPKARKQFLKRQQVHLRALRQAAACTVVAPQQANLQVTLEDAPDPASLGGPIRYLATIANGGPDRAAGVELTIPFPFDRELSGFQIGEAPCQWEVAENGVVPITCRFDSLAVGATATVAIESTVSADSLWRIELTATVEAATPDPVPANNTATTTTNVHGCAASYPTVCIAPPPPDLDCDDVSALNFEVRHDVPEPDPHGFDGNHDGIGCESAGLRSTGTVTPASSVHPTRYAGRALFRTPSNAAYCWLARTLAPENPVIGCWTPNDGFYATIQYARGFRGQAGYQAQRRFEGFTPRGYPLLRFGQNFTWRCRKFNERIGLAENCSRRVGKVAFVCRSRTSGLTCRNRHGHGFWLGRFRGYRLF